MPQGSISEKEVRSFTQGEGHAKNFPTSVKNKYLWLLPMSKRSKDARRKSDHWTPIYTSLKCTHPGRASLAFFAIAGDLTSWLLGRDVPIGIFRAGVAVLSTGTTWI